MFIVSSRFSRSVYCYFLKYHDLHFFLSFYIIIYLIRNSGCCKKALRFLVYNNDVAVPWNFFAIHKMSSHLSFSLSDICPKSDNQIVAEFSSGFSFAYSELFATVPWPLVDFRKFKR